MKRYFSIGIIIFLFLSFSYCKTNDTNWQKDCGAFILTMTDFAIKANGNSPKGETYEKMFINKEVKWALNFIGIQSDNSLLFDLEPFGIREVFFSGKPVMISFKPAIETSQNWNEIKTGLEVKISAIVNQIAFIIMSPGDNPANKIPVAIVSLDNVKIVPN